MNKRGIIKTCATFLITLIELKKNCNYVEDIQRYFYSSRRWYKGYIRKVHIVALNSLEKN